MTLVMVFTTTSNWYRTGLTSLKIRSNRILRNIERAEFPRESRISQTLKNNKNTENMNCIKAAIFLFQYSQENKFIYKSNGQTVR